MKRLFIACLMLNASWVFACDMCSIYLTINPTDYKHSLQLNYRYRSASALIKQGFLNQQLHVGSGYFPEDTYAEEYFHTIDAWGTFFLSERLQLMVNLPYQFAESYYNDTIVQEASGIGDISGLLLYQVHNTKADSPTKFRQRLNVGGGLKLPTGKYKMEMDDEPIQQEFQPGTGSIDLILNAQYLMRYRSAGLSANVLYKVNGENNQQYAFANGANLDLRLFYQLKIKESLMVMPEVGVFYEEAERDIEREVPVYGTGGSATFGTFGLRTFYRDFSLVMSYFTPWSESLNDFQLANKERVVVGLVYTFSK